MGLIKSTLAPTSLVPFSMRDIENHAKQILIRAQRQAEQLLAEAQKEADFLKEAARQEGAVQGRAEGIKQGTDEGRASGHAAALAEHREKFTEVVNVLATLAMELDASRRDMQESALVEVIDLATSIARRVTKRQGLIDPSVLVANVDEAMKMVVQASDIRLAIHPSQRATLTDALPRLAITWPVLEHVELVEDAGLAPGGCRIFTRHGEIGADLDEQLDRVINELMPTDSGVAA